MNPITGDIVRYRGKRGLLAMRAAIVTADVRTLDPRGVESGDIPALDSPQHVHLWVFTPGESGGFTEYNVGPGTGPGEWSRQPSARPAGGIVVNVEPRRAEPGDPRLFTDPMAG